MKDTERGRDLGRREAGSLPREPNAGLNPGTPGSHPELKADRHSTAEPPRRPPLPPHFLKRERERRDRWRGRENLRQASCPVWSPTLDCVSQL